MKKIFSIHYPILFILFLALVLRLYGLEENLIFHGELGHNYLAIKNTIEEKSIPLLGPPTSHPWLSFGPFFYWLFAPVLVAFNFNPVAGAYFALFFSLLAVILNYWVISKLFNRQTALVSSFLMAISPQLISLTREARFYSLVIPFFYPFFYFLVTGINNKGKGLFWAGFFYGIILNFHLSPLIFLPVILFYLVKLKIDNKKKQILKGLLGFVIPSLPFLIYNLKSGFSMLINLTAWIPYRVLGFIGLYPKNTITLGKIMESFNVFFDYFTGFLGQSTLVGSTFLLLLIIGVFKIKKENRKTSLPLKLLLSFFVVSVPAIFLVGDAPMHYYLPVYTFPIIFFSLFLTHYFNKSFLQISFLGLLCIYNLFTMVQQNWYRSWLSYPGRRLSVPFKLQKEAALRIVEDSALKPYTIKRIGYSDQFDGYYAQNYRYLLWLYGNEPIETAENYYIIVEDINRLPKGEILWADQIVIVKERL